MVKSTHDAPDQADAILGDLKSWITERDQLSARLAKAQAAHGEAADVARRAITAFEDDTTDDAHTLARVRATMKAAQDAESDLAAAVRGAQRAVDQHETKLMAVLQPTLQRFHAWSAAQVQQLDRRYREHSAGLAEVAREALCFGNAAAGAIRHIEGVALPGATLLDALLQTPFAIPRSLTERSWTAADNIEIGGQFGVSGVETEASRTVAAVMTTLAPLARELERRSQEQHQAAVKRAHEAALAG